MLSFLTSQGITITFFVWNKKHHHSCSSISQLQKSRCLLLFLPIWAHIPEFVSAHTKLINPLHKIYFLGYFLKYNVGEVSTQIQLLHSSAEYIVSEYLIFWTCFDDQFFFLYLYFSATVHLVWQKMVLWYYYVWKSSHGWCHVMTSSQTLHLMSIVILVKFDNYMWVI